MTSRKLDTEHLAQQIEKILDEDGFSPERLAKLSGIAKTTIYSILNRERPTTQRGVARKIAGATGRTFQIENDQITYSKPHPVRTDQETSSHNLILNKLDASLKNYSDDEKDVLLRCQIEDNFTNMLNMLLSMQASVTSTQSVRSNKIANKQSVENRFSRIWDQLGTTRTEKIIATQSLLRGVNLPKLIYTSYKMTIVINMSGDAHLVWLISATNVGEEDILGELKTMWFETNQLEDINLRGTINDDEPLSIELRRDYENYKEVFCHFGQPIKPRESIRYSYETSPKKMFKHNHYWDWPVQNLILNSRFAIRHKKQQKFKQCIILKDTGQGLKPEENPNLQIKQDAQGVEIAWAKYFPERGAKYRISWDFEEE